MGLVLLTILLILLIHCYIHNLVVEHIAYSIGIHVLDCILRDLDCDGCCVQRI